jgi:hypothetical protein
MAVCSVSCLPFSFTRGQKNGGREEATRHPPPATRHPPPAAK